MSKYHNKPVWHDGIKFDSKKEGDYYLHLKGLQDEGKISDLQMQVWYELVPGIYEDVEEIKQLKTKTKIVHKHKTVQRPICYVADFVYLDTESGTEKVIDVKSKITRKKESYILKKKMMRALKGIQLIEIVL